MIKRTLRDSILYGIGATFSRCLIIIQVPLFAAFLTPLEFGVLDILNITMTMLNLSVALEISQAVAIYYSESKNQESKISYTSTALWFTIFMYSIFCVCALPFSEIIAKYLFGNTAYEYVIPIFIATTISQALFQFMQNQLRWMLKPITYFFINFMHGILSLGLSAILVFKLNLNVYGVIAAQGFASIICAMSTLWIIRSTFSFRLDLTKLKEMLAFSLPLVPSSISIFLAIYIDRLCIKQLIGLEAVGHYGVAHRLASLVGILIAGFSSAITPLIYNFYENEDTPTSVATLLRFYMLIGILMVLFMGSFSKELILLFSSPTYESVHETLPTISSSLIMGSAYIFAPGLAVKKRTILVAVISIIAALLNLYLNIALIPLYGIHGSAFATLISATFVFIGWVVLGHKLYPIPFEWLRIILSILLLYLSLNLISKLSCQNIVNCYVLKVIVGIFCTITISWILTKKHERLALYKPILARFSRFKR